MKRRDIVIGVLLLAALAGVVYYRQNRTEQSDTTDTSTAETLSIEDQIEEKFKLEIPEDVDKAELQDISDGNASGIATRKFEEGNFTHSVLADLPDPESGEFYQVWLIKGEEGSEDFDLISTGRMSTAKGGYILEFQSSTDLSDYNNVLVTKEGEADDTPEDSVLEGSF